VKFSEIRKKYHCSTQLKLSGLDETDVDILAELDSNSRATYAELAIKVGLSRDGVKYRIARMEKKGVILDFSVEVNLKSLGLVCCWKDGQFCF